MQGPWWCCSSQLDHVSHVCSFATQGPRANDLEEIFLPVLLQAASDEDEETRGNAFYGVGLSVENGSESVMQHIAQVLPLLGAALRMQADDQGQVWTDESQSVLTLSVSLLFRDLPRLAARGGECMWVCGAHHCSLCQ